MNVVALFATAAVLAAAVVLLWKMSVQLQAMAERVGRLDEVTRDVQRVGQSISGLEQILASPKLRGSLGEWTLEALLYEVLPHSHVLRQHRLHARGVVVDVAVRTADDRTITIDSKFPLDAFRRVLQAESAGADYRRALVEFHRSVRERVDEIANKYISPEDGTLDFALMYIPSESIYYEIAVRDRGNELLDYAREQRVVICSPNTLYAYLQAIMMGVKGVQIAESAREIQETLEHLRQDFVEARRRFDRASDQCVSRRRMSTRRARHCATWRCDWNARPPRNPPPSCCRKTATDQRVVFCSMMTDAPSCTIGIGITASG